MGTKTTLGVENRVDFVYLFDVRDGNPNGDPDAGNAPRMDPETGHGLVSDVSLKRKVRDYVAAARLGSDRFKIYVKLHSALHEQRMPAHGQSPARAERGGKKEERIDGAAKAVLIEKGRRWMCDNYYDVRAFGAVMSVEDFNCGQVRGPMQLTFARSIDPIADLEQTIVRKAVERADAEKQMEKDGQITGTIGRKSIVPYALYRCHVFFNPYFARDTGFDDQDLELTTQALRMMFDLDRSATRGEMSARALLAFEHGSPLGSAPAASLLDRVMVKRRDATRPARSFADYEVTTNSTNLPAGVTMHQLL